MGLRPTDACDTSKTLGGSVCRSCTRALTSATARISRTSDQTPRVVSRRPAQHRNPLQENPCCWMLALLGIRGGNRSAMVVEGRVLLDATANPTGPKDHACGYFGNSHP